MSEVDFVIEAINKSAEDLNDLFTNDKVNIDIKCFNQIMNQLHHTEKMVRNSQYDYELRLEEFNRTMKQNLKKVHFE